MCHGSPGFPLTAQIADTILEHGTVWTQRHYVKRLPEFVIRIMMQSPPVRRAIRARAMYEFMMAPWNRA